MLVTHGVLPVKYNEGEMQDNLERLVPIIAKCLIIPLNNSVWAVNRRGSLHISCGFEWDTSLCLWTTALWFCG